MFRLILSLSVSLMRVMLHISSRAILCKDTSCRCASHVRQVCVIVRANMFYALLCNRENAAAYINAMPGKRIHIAFDHSPQHKTIHIY